MGKRNRGKKGKSDSENTNKTNNGPVVTTDPRFSKIHSDPRFLKPKFNDNKVQVDERFKGIFDDNMGFKYTAKVDKYGRKQKNDTKEDLEKFYKFESDEESDKTLKNDEKISKGDNSDVSIESGEDSEEDSDEDIESLDPEKKKELIFARSRGEALIGSDSGSEVDDYSTEEEYDEFDETYAGLEQENITRGDETHRFAAMNMDWDNIRSKDLFKVFNSVKPETGTLISVSIYPSEFGKERMEMENTHGPPKEIFENPDKHEPGSDDELANEDDGAEFNQEQLRKYQIDRLKYYYAVVECDSMATAKAIYDKCDGDEFESTANFFDLRFIPDDMVFDDTPRDVATEDPIDYKSATFVTSALTNSRVDLTWDQDDPERVRLIQRSFTEKDLDEMNFDTLLGSDSEEEVENTELREKYLNLIKKGSNNESDSGSDQEMEITFTPGLSEMNKNSLGHNSESSEDDASDVEKPKETTIEKYKRKEKERRQAKLQAKLKSSVDNKVKTEKMTKKELQALKDRENAELELVMMDNNTDSKQHFDMKQVLKSEKKSGRKNKNKNKIDTELTQDDFKIDVNDSRFAALYTSHNFAIDPTNPQFKKTNAMKELLTERQKKHANNSEFNEDNDSKPEILSSAQSSKKELTNLINSVKRKAENFKAAPIKKSKK